MVSCRPVSMAILSLVPTPSLAATRIGSLNPAALRSNSAPKPPRSASAPGRRVDLGQRLDGLHQGIAGVDIHAGIAVGDRRAVVPASWHGGLSAVLPDFRPILLGAITGLPADAGHSRPGRESVGSGVSTRWIERVGEGWGAVSMPSTMRSHPAGGRGPLPGLGVPGRARGRQGLHGRQLSRRGRAENAVAAKHKALADGQQAAFRSLLKRLMPVTAYPAPSSSPP